MGFAFPTGLAALAALAIPILIHLSRKLPREPVRIGSLRHLEGAPAPRRARARVTERWLLAVRLLLLTLLALVIAGMHVEIRGPARAARSVVLLSHDLSTDSAGDAAGAVLDSLTGAGARVVAAGAGDIWSLLSELDRELPPGSSITAVFPASLPVAGARPALRSSVSIHLVSVQAASGAGNSVNVDVDAAAGAADSIPLRVFNAADPARRLAAARVSAAFRAVGARRDEPVRVDRWPGPVSAAAGDWIVQLTDSTPSPSILDAVRGGGVLLIPAESNASGGAAELPPDGIGIDTLGQGLILTVAGLDSASAGAELPALMARIWPDPARLAPAAPARRRVAASQLIPARNESPPEGPQLSLRDVLLALAIGCFLLERWMAHRPRRPAMERAA